MKQIKRIVYGTLLFLCLSIQTKKPILKTRNALFAAVDPSKKMAPPPMDNRVRTSVDTYDSFNDSENKDTIKNNFEMMEKKDEQEKTINPEDLIEFYFENTELSQVLKQIEVLFNVTFITDDVIEPLATGAKSIKGSKVSFKTNEPLTRKQAWNLLTTFLDLSGFALVPEDQPNWSGKAPSYDEGNKFFRVTTVPKAIRSPNPTYIGSDPKSLPDNEQIIRYVYFVQNADLDSLRPVLDALKSTQMTALLLKESRAILLVDKAYNIKNLMKIITELDKVTMPQAMSVIKLYNADADEVKELYDSLINGKTTGLPVRRFPRKQPTSTYFPEGIKVIAETRTNSLILLGPQEAIKNIEEFIRQYVDVELTQPYSPLYVYDVKYADAQNLAEIMNEVTKFGASTPVGRVGGVRGGDEYLKKMSFTAEPATNQLIIKGAYEDYIKALDVIKQLDEPQPQIAIEVMVLAVDINKIKELGTQLRSKLPKGLEGLIGKNVKFQTSGFNGQGIVTKPPEGTGSSECDNVSGASRLLGNLITLATGLQAGNTVIQLGKDICGVWGIFHALDTLTNAQILANPFLVATNNTKAKVSVGETRRVVTSTVVADTTQEAFGDQSANLLVDITPQINSDGMIVMDIKIQLVNFVEGSTPENTARNQREIKTSTIVADKQILALGGLVQNRIQSNSSQVPLLGDVPVLGWLFKNKRKVENKANLLVLISPRILPPGSDVLVNQFTNEHIDKYHETVAHLTKPSELVDPVNRLFFTTNEQDTDEIIFHRRIKEAQEEDKGAIISRSRRGRRRKRAQRKRKKENTQIATNKSSAPLKPKKIAPQENKKATSATETKVHLAHASHVKESARTLMAKNSLTDFILAHNGATK